MSPPTVEFQARPEAQALAVVRELLARKKDPAQHTLADLEQAMGWPDRSLSKR